MTIRRYRPRSPLYRNKSIRSFPVTPPMRSSRLMRLSLSSPAWRTARRCKVFSPGLARISRTSRKRYLPSSPSYRTTTIRSRTPSTSIRIITTPPRRDRNWRGGPRTPTTTRSRQRRPRGWVVSRRVTPTRVRTTRYSWTPKATLTLMYHGQIITLHTLKLLVISLVLSRPGIRPMVRTIRYLLIAAVRCM